MVNLCWVGCPSLDTAVSWIWNNWPETPFHPASESIDVWGGNDSIASQLKAVSQWSHLLWLEKQVMTVKIINSDSPTPDTVTIITTATASKKREIHIMKRSFCSGNTHLWSLCNLSKKARKGQMMIPTKGLDFEMNCWPIQAPTKRANHHESFIQRPSVEVFQDQPPFFRFHIHSWRKSQSSNVSSSLNLKKSFRKVKLRY